MNAKFGVGVSQCVKREVPNSFEVRTKRKAPDSVLKTAETNWCGVVGQYRPAPKTMINYYLYLIDVEYAALLNWNFNWNFNWNANLIISELLNSEIIEIIEIEKKFKCAFRTNIIATLPTSTPEEFFRILDSFSVIINFYVPSLLNF